MKIAAAVGSLALVGSSLGAQAFASGQQDQAGHQGDHASHRHSPRLDHIYVIMLENHSKSSVIGNANAPFMNKLAKHYQMASHYYGVTHPSMPNYIATLAGDNFGIQDDNVDNVTHLHRRNLVDQLEAHHVKWDAYMEDLPANKLADNGPAKSDGTLIPLYAKKHNPFVLFSDVKNNPARMKHVKNYNKMAADLNKKHGPQFVWITPNQCNDMHGGVDAKVAGHPETPCGYGVKKDDANDAALKRKSDAFVKHAAHTIRSSKSWTRHSAIVIITDENDFTGNEKTGGWENAGACCDSPYVGKGDLRVSKDWPGGTYGGGLIPAIIVSPQARRGYVDHTKYNHYSLLTTIEDNWHMGHLGHAGDKQGGVVPMWKVFLR
jgi:hypothetical protein